MTTLKYVRNVALCDCCVSKLVNDDTSSCNYHGCTHEPMQALYATLKSWQTVIVTSTEDGQDVRVPFSTRPCDGCGDTLAGERTYANVYSVPNWYVHIYGTGLSGETYDEYVFVTTRQTGREYARGVTQWKGTTLKATVVRGVKFGDSFVRYTGD